MKNFFLFLKGDPQITRSAGIRPKLKLTALMLPAMFFVIVISSLVQILLVKWGIIGQVKSHGMIPDYMKPMSRLQIVLEIALLAPLLEETAFRGFLQNNSAWFKTAVFSLSYLMICRIGGLNFYELNPLTGCILFVSASSYLISERIIIKMMYCLNQPYCRGILIWCSAFAFGLWHFYNFDFSGADLLTVMISLLPFIINGLILSYVTVKNGLLWSIFLHASNNIWPLILWL
ncbi:CPBP family glutamic-type intramembrane protease [Chryseobacterium hagamense]|uniref:CPBP family glutamic-type intramembrane protease n=1 Tax=Chryseobacterium hagamense TaxID=395935 RepID=UPI00147897C0|nr:CPBP family glutamic-type intramembrane protease [Chryseobacterium hagamense]